MDERTALRDLLALVEDGILVRATEHDQDSLRFALDGMRLVRVLATAQAIVNTEGT